MPKGRQGREGEKSPSLVIAGNNVIDFMRGSGRMGLDTQINKTQQSTGNENTNGGRTRMKVSSVITILLVSVILLGCSTSSGPVPFGKDSYMITVARGKGLSYAAKEASAHCASMGKEFIPRNTSNTFQGGFQGFTATLIYSCVDKEEMPRQKIATMQEKEKRAMAECKQKRLNGELKGYAESAQCSNPLILEAHREAGDPNMDLTQLLCAYRLALAERNDKGEMTEAEAQVAMAELGVRVSQEVRQRATQQQAELHQESVDLQQQNNARMQAYGTLLQGLGTWQSANKIEMPKVSIPQTAMPNPVPAAQPRISITCQRVGDFTYCH